jgi:acetyl-CoA synthetase
MGAARLTAAPVQPRPVSRLCEARHQEQWSLPQRYSIAHDALLSHQPEAVAAIEPGPDGRVLVTFGQVQSSALRFASLLQRRGVRPGDRVAVYLDPSVAASVVVFGVLAAGAVLLTVPRLLAGTAVSYRLHDSGAAVLVTDAAGAERLETTGCSLGEIDVLAVDGTSAASLDDLLSGVSEAAPPDPGAEDPAILMYTSGTSGHPKGVMHAQRVLLGHSGVDYAFELFRPGDVYFGTADWGWIGGIMLGLLVPWSFAVPIVAQRPKSFDANATLDLWAACGVTTAFLPPSVLRLLRSNGRPAAPRLRAVVTGGEPATPDELDWARRNLADAVNKAYGQTEANALIGDSAALGSVDSATMGAPYPGHRIAILDEEGRDVGEGEVGEICLRLPDASALLGYWDRSQGRAHRPEGGVLRTGDLGQRVGRRVSYVGRRDDVIKTRGYRVGPAEIEAALTRHPDVLDAAAVGVPDAGMGQRVKAFIRLAPTQSLDAALQEELKALVRREVGAHAYPREFAVVDELPRTETGKLRRRALAASPVVRQTPDQDNTVAAGRD